MTWQICPASHNIHPADQVKSLTLAKQHVNEVEFFAWQKYQLVFVKATI